tara:strand:- start:211 stop:1317 length:1107 start_codon:yes stop_codon:yes gene_type:complete
MSQKRVTIVLGTRPEAIKLAPIIIKLIKYKLIQTRIVLTGQHKELVNDVVNLFGIKIDLDLGIMKKFQTLEEITSLILKGLTKELKNYPSDLIIVQGDTTSAFASALAAFYEKIPIAHVEAGLRTNNLMNPFPEEANRRLISSIANLHYAPTNISKDNLINSGISNGIEVTGNTVIDSLMFMKDKSGGSYLKDLDLLNKKFILCTFHRRENWGNNLKSILYAISSILNEYKDVNVLVPMHPNLIVRNDINQILSSCTNAFLVEPLRYDHFVEALKNCYFVLTDSGGLQEEAPAFGKPVLVVRDTTERIEAIQQGTAKLLGTKQEMIYKEVKNLIDNKNDYESMSKAINPYGDGKASERIFNSILKFLF